MTPESAERTIPPRVPPRPPSEEEADLLVLLALRELGRVNLPRVDVVYSFGRRTSG